MNKNFPTTIMLLWALVLMACSNHATEPSSPPKMAEDSMVMDSHIVPKEELTKLYSLAIADYIKAVNKEYNITFDTLFFGKHVYGQPDDFPDITLPETINNTPIRLISPEVGETKLKERKSLFYINLMGFVDPQNAEFIFVNFSNFGEHQFDCFINYTFNLEQKAFVPVDVRFKNYLYKRK